MAGKLGIIGGSGLYEMDGLKDVRTRSLTTPFGLPSDDFVCGALGGCEIFFLPRHGRGHRILPAEINHRANVHAFKQMGVERIISISAVGSLKEELRPRDILLPDQYFDRTKGSLNHTFFGGGMVAHIGFGEPTCADLRKAIAAIARAELDTGQYGGTRLTEGGTYVNMEGPAFSTRAESNFYRALGFDAIGMTSLPEAKLCREAEICYQAIAMVTDYDCWHSSEAPVTVEMIIGHLQANIALAKNIIRRFAAAMPAARSCACRHALREAIITAPDAIPQATRNRLALLTAKYSKFSLPGQEK